MLNALIISAVILFGQGAPDRVRDDANLVAPGRGAERVLLNETEAEVTARRGRPEKIASFDNPRDLFGDIMGVSASPAIPFTRMAWYENSRCAVFYSEGRVSAIAGTDMERVTADSADLRRGMEYFTYAYGNANRIVTEKNGSRMFIYPLEGIAVADDGSDGTIDLYIVFPPRGER